MCGIAGAVATDPASRTPAVVRAMLRSIAHRGPDDEGVETLGIATIGARRLAIIDLQGGHQPMTNEDGSIIAVQNGEIYNFMEVRTELERRGHQFRTRSDTEVIPHAYEEWGEACVEHLRGMFALAIWDERRRSLVLARDRFGKKPLFYAQAGANLVFGSEIQSVLAHPAVDREVDDRAIQAYLTFGYVPAPATAFARITKVLPAHTVVFSDGGVRERRYWQLRFVPKIDISAEDAADETRRLIEEAVRVRLISDVPIGAFLSGGLDSSTVVAFMARNSQQPVKTFSIGFADRSFDESNYARVVARAFATDHHELVVDAEQTDVLPRLIRHVGEPFADSSIVPSYHVARITRQHVTVAMNGDGGDELFAGYDRYRAASLTGAVLDHVPQPLRRAVAHAAARFPMSGLLPRPIVRARRFLSAIALPPEARFLRWTGYFTGSLRDQIAGERGGGVDPALQPLLAASEVTGAQTAAERYMASDTLLNLPNDLLVKMDIATMASSLEARSPLLDHELAEFVARLPVHYKLSPASSKIILRRAMHGILPDEILRRRKMGFMAPVGDWLRGPLRPMFSDLVLSRRSADRGYVSIPGATRLFEEHISGIDRSHWLWSLLILELWFREMVDVPSAIEPTRPLPVAADA